MVLAKRIQVVDCREDEPVPLVRDTGATLRFGREGILDGGRASDDQRVLAVVYGARKGVGEAEVETARDAAAYGDGHAVIDAGRRALERLDGPNLRYWSCQLIDTWRKG